MGVAQPPVSGCVSPIWSEPPPLVGLLPRTPNLNPTVSSHPLPTLLPYKWLEGGAGESESPAGGLWRPFRLRPLWGGLRASTFPGTYDYNLLCICICIIGTRYAAFLWFPFFWRVE